MTAAQRAAEGSWVPGLPGFWARLAGLVRSLAGLVRSLAGGLACCLSGCACHAWSNAGFACKSSCTWDWTGRWRRSLRGCPERWRCGRELQMMSCCKHIIRFRISRHLRRRRGLAAALTLMSQPCGQSEGWRVVLGAVVRNWLPVSALTYPAPKDRQVLGRDSA